MTMVSSGEISIGGNATSGGLNRSINIELGRSATATSSLNESALRTLAGVPSGAISLSNFYGKSNTFSFTISSNQTNANLRTLAVNAGWDQTSQLIATINGGVYCSSNSTGTPGLTINGSFPNGVSLVNNGFIIGMGGAGGAGSGVSGNTFIGGSAGAAGGLALSVSSAVTITNNGTIGGGGGGGGGGQGGQFTISDGKFTQSYNLGGGGGGGGRSSAAANSSGGSGGTATVYTPSPGAAGGAGTSSSAGGGGGGGSGGGGNAGSGGSGGGWGSSGSSGNAWSPLGFSQSAGGPYGGGSAGGAISGNSNISWVAFGTRLGSIT